VTASMGAPSTSSTAKHIEPCDHMHATCGLLMRAVLKLGAAGSSEGNFCGWRPFMTCGATQVVQQQL
jgi:hypothetical protein